MVNEKESSPSSEDEFKRYESETGKHAIWRGIVTEGFIRWQGGEKVYNRNKDRIALYVSDETKGRWQSFIDENRSLTLSKLIRESVDFFIEVQTKNPGLRKLSEIARILKGPLTGIKGFAQLIAENHNKELGNVPLSQIREIIEKSTELEEKIQLLLEDERTVTESKCDILIVDKDTSAIKVLISYFEYKGLKCKGMTTGSKIITEIKASKPKVMLVDTLLPDVSGYEICKQVKENAEFSTIPFYFISALPASEIEYNLTDLKVDGFFMKPYNFREFRVLEKFF